MAELPTQKELEQLYYEKGNDALVWYAWRCFLRTLLNLGKPNLTTNFSSRVINLIYRAIRVSILLSQWKLNAESTKQASYDYPKPNHRTFSKKALKIDENEEFSQLIQSDYGFLALATSCNVLLLQKIDTGQDSINLVAIIASTVRFLGDFAVASAKYDLE